MQAGPRLAKQQRQELNRQELSQRANCSADLRLQRTSRSQKCLQAARARRRQLVAFDWLAHLLAPLWADWRHQTAVLAVCG